MKKLKVLIISHAYAEEANLAKVVALAKCDDLEVGVLYPEKWRTWHGEDKVKISERTEKELFHTFTLPTLFSGDSGLYFFHPFKLLRLLREFNPDIIHLEEEPWTPVAGETAFIAKKLKKKLIFFSWENIDLYLNYWRCFIEKFVFRHSYLAIAGNQGARARLGKQGYRGRIKVLPQLGVDLKRFNTAVTKVAPRQTLGLNGLVIGYAGRLSMDKGLETLFRAFALLDEPNISLLLVTSSSRLPEYLQNLCTSLKINTRVKSVMNTSHAEFPDYLRIFNIQVLPSLTTPTWKEQFGRVMIEGMACGVPVVGSSSGAIPEVLGEAGLVFKEGDAEDLKEKLELLLRDVSLREKMGQAGQDRVKKLYSYPAIAEKTREIYLSLDREPIEEAGR